MIFKRLLNYSYRKMSSNSAKGVSLREITAFLNCFAPDYLAESWDNTGLLVEPSYPRIVDCVLLTNDLTEDVVEEALDLDVGLIISYHPPIFKGLTKLTSNSWKERIICTCLENKIAVFSPHTRWDSVPGGVNDWLASCFEVESIKPISENTKFPGAGGGRYCVLKNELLISDALLKVKKLTSLRILNVAFARGACLETRVRDVAICAGSGTSILSNARAELFLTGEISHHILLDATHNGTTVILCKHSSSERGFLKAFAMVLNREFSEKGVKVFVSKEDKEPLQYL